jgi:hypothetical protein
MNDTEQDCIRLRPPLGQIAVTQTALDLPPTEHFGYNLFVVVY